MSKFIVVVCFVAPCVDSGGGGGGKGSGQGIRTSPDKSQKYRVSWKTGPDPLKIT